MAKHTGIKKLPNGRFRARYFAGYDKNGKRNYPAKTFDTEREAREWRSSEVLAKNPGRYCEGRGLTVEVYLNRWLETKRQSIRENSYISYRQSLDLYVKPLIGKLRLSRLSPTDIESMQAQLLAKERKLSRTTVSAARGILHGALQKAVRQGVIRSNPVQATDGPGIAKPKRYPLTVNDAVRFLKACESAQRGLLFAVSLNTGLRPEEMIALRWSDIETGIKSVIRVSRVIHAVQGGGWQWQEPKTKNSDERAIVLPDGIASQLQEHRRAQLEQKLKAGRIWQDLDLVFCNPIGAPLSPWTMRRHLKKILSAAGLSTVHRWYDLRHAFVSFSLIAGVDAKTVSREAGHSRVAFTLDKYGHVLDEMHESASEKREGLLKSRASKK